LIIKGGYCDAPVQMIGVSMPRSGHHLMERLLEAVLQDDLFYCEYYSNSTCCQITPCIRRENRPVSFQKSHDFNLDIPQDIDSALYLIQHRRPVPMVLSAREHYALLEYDESYGDAIGSDRGEYAVWLGQRAAYYLAFSQRWIQEPPASSIVVDYDDLTHAPAEALARVLATASITVPHEVISESVATTMPRAGRFGEHAFVPRSIEASRYYDHALLATYESILVDQLPTLAAHRVFEPVPYLDTLMWRVFETRQLWRRGDSRAALALVDHALEREPENGLLLHEQATLLEARGRLHDAQRALLKAVTLPPPHPVILGALVRISAILEDQVTARRAAESLLTLVAPQVAPDADAWLHMQLIRPHVGVSTDLAGMFSDACKAVGQTVAASGVDGSDGQHPLKAPEMQRLQHDEAQQVETLRQLQHEIQRQAAELRQKDRVIAELTRIAGERLALVERLSAVADERLALIERLSAAADERLTLIERLHTEAARLTDELRQRA
jgi:hypothetical protein